MSSPALALTPMPISVGTGAGANTGLASGTSTRYRTLCESMDGKQEGLEGGRFMARHGPGAAPSPFLPGPGSRIGPVRGRT